MKTNNFGQMEGQSFEPDYQMAFQNDPGLLLVIAKINTLMAQRGFPLRDFESAIKKRARNNNNQVPYRYWQSDLVTELGIDLIIQLTYTINQRGGQSSVTFNMQALDAYTQEQVAGAQGTGTPRFSTDLPVLLEEAVLAHIENFTASLSDYFQTLISNGRSSMLTVRFDQQAEVDFQTIWAASGKNQLLSTVIDDFFRENTPKSPEERSNYLRSFRKLNQKGKWATYQLQIYLFDLDKRPISLEDFIEKFRLFLFDLGFQVRTEMSGLSEAEVIIQSQAK